MKAPNTSPTTDHNENSMNFTLQELQEWIKAGLIPLELLEPSKKLELFDFIRKNIKMLYTNYHRNFEEDHYLMKVPPENEWSNAPDIEIIDRRTGETVKILEMRRNFELCEGISLQIKAKELNEWEKKTSHAKNLNKEQKEIFKVTMKKIISEKPILTREEIVTIIEEIRKPPKNKTFRQSRELIDNKLDRRNENDQLTFFDLIDKKDKKIKDLHPEGPIIKGLDLDQGEDRILHTLTLLLCKKSENKDQNSKDYYMGNYEKGIFSINDLEMETARITVSPHEFYSTYYGKDDYGSDQIKYILNKLDSLSKKMFLTTWKFPSKNTTKSKKTDEKRYDLFRTYCPLFAIAILNSDLSESECQTIENNKDLLDGKRCKFLFKFQPQFTNNIREQYVEFPEDIYLRISEAIGKDRYSISINLMRDFLFREKQQAKSKKERHIFLRDKETIINILKLDKYWKEGKKKVVNERIKECFEIFLKIGLIKNWEETQGKRGQIQYMIQINRDFK